MQGVWGGALDSAFLTSSQVMTTLTLLVQGPYFENLARVWGYLILEREDSEVWTMQSEPPRMMKPKKITQIQLVCEFPMPNTEATQKQPHGRSLVTAGSSKYFPEISRRIPT